MQVKGDSSLNKLIILFVFDKMEVPLSENTILDMCCSSNNWIAYMDCQPIIAQLIEHGFIYDISTSSGEPMYTITPDGRVCLANFFVKNSREHAGGNSPVHQKQPQQIPQKTGMRGGLLHEQGRYIYGLS